MMKTTDAAKPKQRQDSLIEEVSTLMEFKKAIVDESDSLTVVRFYAPWCRACRAMAPGFFGMAKKHPKIKFVQVAVTDENVNLHQGLGVPSIPYVHLYHPQGGLVEEQKLTRKHLSGFNKILQDYENLSCSLDRDDEWSSDNPYFPRSSERSDEDDDDDDSKSRKIK